MELHRGPYVRGTTIPAVELEFSQPVVAAVCAQVRDRYGRLVYMYPDNYTSTSILLQEIPAGVSANFPVGSLSYDVRVLLTDGSTSQLLHGSTMEFVQGVSTCNMN